MTGTLRIAFHADSPPRNPTGIGRYARQLAEGLTLAGSRPEMWVRFRWREDLKRQLGPGYRIRSIFSAGSVEDRVSSLLYSRSGTDLLHCPNGNLLPVSRKVKRTLMVHDMCVFLFDGMKEELETAAWREKITDCVGRADGFLVNSPTTMHDFLELFPEASDRTWLTPLGMDHLLPGAPAEDALRVPGGPILAVGTIEPRKNYPTLLRAYSILRGRRMDAPPLVIAGRNGFRSEEVLELMDELSLSGSVRTTGYVTEERLKELYSDACCLVHPALYEGFGFTIPEAFTYGLPVVAADNSSMADFFTGAVRMVDCSDPEAMADAMEQSLDGGVPPDHLEARRKLFERYTWENCADLTLSAFDRVCSG